VTLDRRRAGEALSNAAPDLARVWRAGRAAARPGTFPGLLDGIAEAFIARAGEALAAGRDPALVWPSVEGPVRVHARDARRTREELEAEWDLLEEVLQTACQALDAGDAVREWIARAVVMARGGARALTGVGGPPGVLVVRLYSEAAATRRGRAPAPW